MVKSDYLNGVEEDTDPTDDGEVIKYIKDFKKESEEMIANLLYVDELLQSLERRLELGEVISPEDLVEKIKEIRHKVGQIKEEEEDELGGELIANNLLNKLKKMVEEVV